MPDARVRIRRESVRLSPLLTEVVARVTPPAQDAGVEIRTRLPGDLPSLHGDGRLVTEAFVALLEDRLTVRPRGGEREEQDLRETLKRQRERGREEAGAPCKGAR